MPTRLATMAALLLLSGCAIEMPRVPMARFAAGDLAAVIAFCDAAVRDGPSENHALLWNVRGQCDLYLGDLDSARRHLGAAGRIMGNWQVSGGEEFAAIVGSEASRIYRGDPYEKAMNAFYLGLCYLFAGEPDNARAAWKRGILADGESGDEKYQADFGALFWLAGRASMLMGLPGDAADLFTEARQADAFARAHGARTDVQNPLFAEPRRGNLVLLIECGMGPEKYAAGAEAELARFRPRPHPAVRAQVWLGGRLVGPSYILTDVDYQARTRGGSEMEGIRAGKAVFKSVTRAAGVTALVLAAGDNSRSGSRDKALAGTGLLLLSSLTSSAADVRHWPTLPSTVQALALEVPPGAHLLRIEFLDSRGRLVPDLTQEWTVEVPMGSEAFYLFRALPGLDRKSQSKP